MSLAIPKDEEYTGLSFFNNKKVATSYPSILRDFFAEKNINVEIEEIGGSVEIAPGIGLADAIFDIVSTGSTLLMNGLKEVEVVVESEAALISNRKLSDGKKSILNRLVFRIKSVLCASENKYITLNAPLSAVEEITKLLPGMKSPTIVPLAEKDWCGIHSVVKEDEFWDVIDKMKALGAEGILVIPIEKMVL
jgi:ATP phosphoribosyltransferase